ncbi:sensor domain-containing diguanylate cyclase [Fusobacterium sp.]|uniref:sensor domain-containing diguanylate cyclase n=1 Tax=Fusobacterium sp. TaxID=68766 RepID=UPI002612786C|nr:sensor domain-containing diguanylate cyclase [Fusobacterium sp.]
MKKFIIKDRTFIAIILLLICVVIVSFFSLQSTIKREEIKRFQENFNKTTHYSTLNAKLLIDEMIKDLNKMSKMIGKYENIHSPFVKDILIYTQDLSYFNVVGVVDENGDGYNSFGDSFNLSNRDYFKKSSVGKLGVSNIFKSKVFKDKYAQIFSYPLYDKKKNIKGIVFGAFYFDSIEKITNIRLRNDDKTKLFFLDSAGNYINNNEFFKNNFTFWNYLEDTEISKNYITEIKRSFKEDRSLGYNYKKNGITYYGHSFPFDNLNGYLVSETNDREVTNYIDKINSLVLKEELITGSCFVLMIFLICVYFRRINNETKEANKKAEDNMEIICKVAEHSQKTVFSYDSNTKTLSIKTNLFDNFFLKDLSSDKVINNFPESLISSNIVDQDSIKNLRKLFCDEHDQNFIEIKTIVNNKEEWSRISIYNKFNDKKNNFDDIVGIIENITQEKLRESEHEKKLEIYEKLIKNAIFYAKADLCTDTVFELNGKNVKLKLSEFLRNDFLLKIKTNYLDYVIESFSFKNLNNIFNNGNDLFKLEFLVENKEVEQWVSCIIYKINTNDNNKILFVVKDIDQKKKRELELKNRAEKDGLTGLYNSITLRNKIEEALQIKNFNNLKRVFIILDLDNFKEINDKFGHSYGDKVLIEIAKILKNRFRSNDIIGRLGGDEFVIFLNGVEDYEAAEKYIQCLKIATEKVYEKENLTVKISGSIGFSISPDDGSTFEELYTRADLALYEIKKCGKNNYKKYTK